MGYRYNAITGELDVVDTSAGDISINQIDTDAGSAVPVAGIVNILGTAAQGISSSGAGNTVTLTIADSTETQKGVIELATDVESIAGTDTSRAIVPTSLKAKLGSQTAKAIPFGAGDTNAISWTAGMADGNLIIGSTAGNPTPAFLTSTDASVVITNGANSIDLSAGAAVPTLFVTDAGTATPAVNILNVLGGNNIGTTGAANNLTINLTGTTDHCVQVGNASGSLTSLGAGTTGELLIGNTGADAAFGSTAYADFSFSNVTGVGVPRTLNIVNTDVNVASYSDLRLSTAPLGGDAMISWEIQGTLFYAMGVDNSDSDIWKLTTSSDPSGGTTAIAVDNGTAAVKFANAYEFPVADGTASYPLVTDGAGNLDFNSLTVAGGGTGLTTITDHAVLVGSGINAITPIAMDTNGMLLIGSNGADPVAATLASADGSVTITNGAGSIDLAVVGTGMPWTVKTDAAVALAVDNGYITNRAAGITYTLPDTAAAGSIIRIAGLAGLWTVAQNAGESINFGNQTTTVGVGGSLVATNANDAIELLCIVANTTWTVISSIGNLTVN